MRASATSQTNLPANISASPAKADVHKADAASPFALMMEATAKDPAKAVTKDAKDSGDKPTDRRNDAKQSDVKQNDVKQNRNAAAAQTPPQAKPAASARAGKPGKDSDKNDTVRADEGAANDKQIATAEQPASGQQAPPPLAQALITVPADPALDAQTDVGIDGATPIGQVAALSPAMPSSSIDMPQSGVMDAPAGPGEIAQAQTTPQAAPQAPSQPGDDPADESETAVASVAAQIAGPPVTAKDAAKPVKSAAKSEPASTAKPQTAGVERAKDDLTQSAKVSDSDEAKPAKTDLAKTDLAKPDSTDGASLKPAHNSVASNAKADTGASDKTDAPRADARPVETGDATPAAAKPAPQSATMSNFAINTIAAPQAAQHSQAPSAAQHVQVTAQAAPDVPALAVEIAAKSQSGAKQFDIRLDPPELGRVEVRLSIDATGKASAHLSADQPQTLSLLQKDAPILTRALREAGLDVSQDGLNFSLRHQAHDHNGHDGNNSRFGGSRAFSLAATASIDPTAAVIAYRGLADGRVDIRV